MNLRGFARRVESDLIKFEREIRNRQATDDGGKGDPIILDYEDWFELFIEHTMPESPDA